MESYIKISDRARAPTCVCDAVYVNKKKISLSDVCDAAYVNKKNFSLCGLMYLLPYYVSFISLRRQPCLNDVTNTSTPLPPFFWKKCDFNSTILDSNQ